MNIAGSTAFVTGANRGLGKRLAAELVKRGTRVYAGARDPGAIDLPGVTPVRLDITDHASIMSALAVADDTTFLINNAGSSTRSTLLEGDLRRIRLEMETHYFGTLAMTRAFAAIIAANGGGAMLNVLSMESRISRPQSGSYSAAKSAEWSLTNALRQELAPWNIRVSALHVRHMDTDMVRGLSVAKTDPGMVAALALDGVAAGCYEILANEISRHVQAKLAGGVAAMYPDLP
jgi:NAD(P)-dependent dehydrogenase (short-subunit alcohol dehydrogenase family)